MKTNNANDKKNLKLIFAVLVRFVVAFVIIGLLLFLTAGSFSYINGWIFLITLLILMGFGFIILYIKDKTLLEKRMRTKEREKQQILFIVLSIIVVSGIYILPGIDYRFGWSHVPVWMIIMAEIVLLVGYIMYLIVMLQNSYASRVVEIQEKQKLIDTGLYGLVRHPMYLATILIYISSPIILGSYIGLIFGLLFPFLLVMRIYNEEKVLINGLEGYEKYIKKVKYRLIPFVW